MSELPQQEVFAKNPDLGDKAATPNDKVDFITLLKDSDPTLRSEICQRDGFEIFGRIDRVIIKVGECVRVYACITGLSIFF